MCLLIGPLVMAQGGVSVCKGQGLYEPFSEHGQLRGCDIAKNHGRKGSPDPEKQGPGPAASPGGPTSRTLQPGGKLSSQPVPQIKGKSKLS